jgi:hypothetical protein
MMVDRLRGEAARVAPQPQAGSEHGWRGVRRGMWMRRRSDGGPRSDRGGPQLHRGRTRGGDRAVLLNLVNFI